jgi:HlyD family secretion protein
VKTKWKVLISVLVVILLAGGLIGGIRYSKRGVVTVQTDKVERRDLTAIVTASGEIKPRDYINIGTNAAMPARIVDIAVVEGQQVEKGQLLARLESVQPQADVAAQRASLSSSKADVAAAEASLRASEENLKTTQASVDRATAELESARISFERTRSLHEERLIAQQEFDQKKVDFAAAQATVREAEARQLQAQAQRAEIASQLEAARRRVTLSEANLERAEDVLQRTYAVAPIAGMVTNLPVRVGETVVPGIQNSSASLLMTIADMSVITAEVKVDETDIVNVKLDQLAEISIDAIPNKTFSGRIIEIGNTAILRSTGQAASQSAVSSQEAKDFKVVIALEDPPPEIRPGLSCTARITTATRENALSIPIQALTVRQKGDLVDSDDSDSDNGAEQLDEEERKKELQGVFVVENDEAVFHEVETGITGATDIEVLNGLDADQEIITGSYQVIRTIKNEARIKVNNQSSRTES